MQNVDLCATSTRLVVGPDVTVERLVSVDVPVHAEHAAPAGLVARRAPLFVVVIGATK